MRRIAGWRRCRPAVLMAAMQLPAAVARWLSGWAELARRDAVPGYAVRGRLARLGLDIAALGAALTCGGTGFAALVALATGLGGLVLAWELDLAGWQRDALLCLPVVLVAPWVAAGRRRRLEALLAAGALLPATAVTDGARAPGDSPALGQAEPGWPWQRMRRRATQDRASAPRRRWWPWPAWRCWQRWRSRGNATRRA